MPRPSKTKAQSKSKQPSKTKSDTPVDPDSEGEDYQDFDFRSESDLESDDDPLPRNRMQMTKQIKIDAPTKDYEPRPLLHIDALRLRNQQAHLPTRVFKTKDGFVLFVHMLHSTDVEDYKVYRDKEDHRMIQISCDSMLADEETLKGLFEDPSRTAEGENSVLLGVNSNDSTYQAFITQLSSFNGTEVEQVVPKTFMCVRLDESVKAKASPWQMVRDDGKWYWYALSYFYYVF